MGPRRRSTATRLDEARESRSTTTRTQRWSRLWRTRRRRRSGGGWATESCWEASTTAMARTLAGPTTEASTTGSTTGRATGVSTGQMCRVQMGRRRRRCSLMPRWCWGHSRLPAQPPDKRLPRFAKTFKSYYTHTHIILKTERNYIYSLPSSILIPDHAPSQILFQNYLSKVVIIVTQVVVLTQKCSWRVDI